MLSIGKIAAGPAAARYYLDQVARGREDYYAGEGEAPGRWVGSANGRRGVVGPEAFTELLAGGGLRQPTREGAVAGFDLTFRAPKSVSVLWGLGSPEQADALRAGHDAAVDEALGYLEREACRARRGHAGAVQVPGTGFVGAAFMHRASPAGDPLLHSHVVVGNLTQGPDERWTALDARHLYRHVKTAGYLYQAVLRRELTERLGLEWTAVDRGVADIRGVPRGVIEHFSRRRAQILEHMAQHGGRSAASAQIAALETRQAKQDMPLDRLRADWRSRAEEHGLTARVVERIFRSRSRMVPLTQPVASEALTRKASVFGRPELLQALAAAQPAGAGVRELERLADLALADREVVALRDGPAPAGLTEPRFTTRELLRIERELLDGAQGRRKSAAAIAGADTVIAALAERSLSDEQASVVVDLCRQGEGVAVVRAPAGTGKTFVLDAAREAWQASGIEVVGCALSARAALELSDQAAIDTVTIATLQHRIERGFELPHHGVLVVDEAGMVGTRDLANLADAADRADAKLVLVGDDRQLPEIQAGGAFRALADDLGALELREVRRQRQAWDRQALEELRNGEVERWARAYRAQGQITIAASAEATRAALVNDWSRADGDRLMIAGRREDVADLNQRARELRQARGDLGHDEIEVAGRAFGIGDRIIGLRNDRSVGILNGQRGIVEAIDPDRESLQVQLDQGEQIEIPAAYLKARRLDHGYAITAHRAQGATVDRTFVLGSQELYREWGYTALSRHRDEARFYIARADIDLDRDIAPQVDPVIAGIERLIGRSHAKDLAIESLPELDRDELERDRTRLRKTIERDPPPDDLQRRELDDEIERATIALHEAHERQRMVRKDRERLRWRERQQRADLDNILEQNLEYQRAQNEHLQNAIAQREIADTRDQRWLDDRRPTVERLLAVEQEVQARDTIDRQAERRVHALSREHQHRDRPLESHDLAPDVVAHDAHPLDLDPYHWTPPPPPPPPRHHRPREVGIDLHDLDLGR